MIKPFIIISLLFGLVFLWLFINEYRIRKDPLYKQKQIEAEKRRQEAVKRKEEQEKKNKIEKQLEEQKLRQQVAYNAWMREVYHYPVSSFQITDSEYKNDPQEGPWASSLFNDDVRAHINSQDVPLHLRGKKDIKEVKYGYSPQGLEEGQIIMDIFLTKGPKAAEIALEKNEKKPPIMSLESITLSITRALSGQASPILANLSFYSYSFILNNLNAPAPAAYAQCRYTS